MVRIRTQTSIGKYTGPYIRMKRPLYKGVATCASSRGTTGCPTTWAVSPAASVHPNDHSASVHLQWQPASLNPTMGALIIRIGFGGILYSTYHEEPPQNPILTIFPAPFLLAVNRLEAALAARGTAPWAAKHKHFMGISLACWAYL